MPAMTEASCRYLCWSGQVTATSNQGLSRRYNWEQKHLQVFQKNKRTAGDFLLRDPKQRTSRSLLAESPVHWGNVQILQVGKCNKDIIFQWDKHNNFKLMFNKHNLITCFILFHQKTLANDCWADFSLFVVKPRFRCFLLARTFDRPNQNKHFKRSKACCKWDKWVSEWV